AQLLQIGEKSYTRWESGRVRPSRVINVLLRLLYDGRIDVEDLRSLNRHKFDWRKVVQCQFRKAARPMAFSQAGFPIPNVVLLESRTDEEAVAVLDKKTECVSV